MSDDFDGVTPDMVRAAEKRAAALAADRGEVEEPAERAEPPKGRRSKPSTVA